MPRVEVVPRSEFFQPADMVFLAMSFTGMANHSLLMDLDIVPWKKGLLSCEPAASLAAGVYACGDAVSGPSLAVKAIADGLAAAGSF